jgi:hypothetical protein
MFHGNVKFSVNNLCILFSSRISDRNALRQGIVRAEMMGFTNN